MNPTDATKEAEQFLEQVFRDCLDPLFLELRFIPVDSSLRPIQRFVTGIEQIDWDEVWMLNGDGYSITFGVAPRQTMGGKKSDVGAVVALWADIDFDKVEEGEDGVIEMVAVLPRAMTPSAAIRSGHGYHLYWFLDRPIPVTDDNRASLEAILKGLQARVGSDAVHDLNRVMRLPGSVNGKDPSNPRPCTVISLDPDRRVTLDELSEVAKQVKIPTAERAEVKFPAEPPSVAMKDLRISEAMKTLVKIGWQDGGRYLTRSEAQQAVVTAMCREQHSPAEILAVFQTPKWQIGERHREIMDSEGEDRARAQLALSISKARQFLTEEAAKNSASDWDVLYEGNPEQPDLAEVERVVMEHFPDFWTFLEIALSTVAALLPSDNSNPPTLVFEGPSGSGKTTIIDMLDGSDPLAYRSDSFTVKSFVSHMANIPTEELAQVDLLPRIRFRVLLTPELAPLFRGREDDLKERFSVLTTILDGHGYTTDSGVHGRRGYRGDYPFAWIGATTPLPNRAWEVMQQLGGRLLFGWFNLPAPSAAEVTKTFRSGLSYKEKLACCKAAVNEFVLRLFQQHATPGGKRPYGVDWRSADDVLEVVEAISSLASMLAVCRTPVSVSRAGAEPNFESGVPEHSYRLTALLINLARGHALIRGRTSLTHDDLPPVVRVALDSMQSERRLLLRLLLAKEAVCAVDVEAACACSRPKAIQLMRLMVHLGVACTMGEGSGALTIGLHPEHQWLRKSPAVMAVVSGTFLGANES